MRFLALGLYHYQEISSQMITFDLIPRFGIDFIIFSTLKNKYSNLHKLWDICLHNHRTLVMYVTLTWK
jgi:hypothetical protein